MTIDTTPPAAYNSYLGATVSSTKLSCDWTNVFIEDITSMVYYYAVGTVELRGSQTVLDWTESADRVVRNVNLGSRFYDAQEMLVVYVRAVNAAGLSTTVFTDVSPT